MLKKVENELVKVKSELAGEREPKLYSAARATSATTIISSLSRRGETVQTSKEVLI